MNFVIASLTIGLAFGAATTTQMPHQMHQQPANQNSEFQRIEQPIETRTVVTIAGLGLISLELWWFLFNKPKPRQAAAKGGIQEVIVRVDGGYDPSYIVVKAGQPLRLKFDRTDPTSCLEEVQIPDFRIAKTLPLNQTTAIEFTPEQPGNYTFTCGMNMFRGAIEVQPAEPVAAEQASLQETKVIQR